MKTIGKFKQLGHNFIVKVNILKTNSNHNTFAHVFHEGEKQPLCGTSFADGTSKDDIILWAKKRVDEIQSEELANDIFSHRQPQTTQEKWPELDTIASDIEKWCIDAINNRRQHVKTECPYVGQGILEMLIARLEKDV